MNSREIRIAVVQVGSANGRVAENLARAAPWVQEAGRQRADIALLPELFSTGFELSAMAWRAAEAQGGPTEQWLTEQARRHGFCIGGSYLERREGDYFDTFALAGASGILGRVRKRHPCSLEAYVFKGGDDPHVMETPLGRIGVAICYDASLREVWDRILPADPDLVLMPMSAPTPVKTVFFGQKKIDAFHASFSDGATQTAKLFGIPCAMSNKWGQWHSAVPGWLARIVLGPQHSHFPGFSHVADGDGREVARVKRGEGVAVGTVRLSTERKRLVIPKERSRFRPWISDVPLQYRAFALFEALGRRSYAARPTGTAP